MSKDDWYRLSADRTPFFLVHFAGGCRITIAYASVQHCFANPQGDLRILASSLRVTGRFIERAYRSYVDDSAFISAQMALLETSTDARPAVGAAEADSTGSAVDGGGDGEPPGSSRPLRSRGAGDAVSSERQPAGAFRGQEGKVHPAPSARADRAGHLEMARPVAVEAVRSQAELEQGAPAPTQDLVLTDLSQSLADFQEAFAELRVKGLHHIPGVMELVVEQRTKKGWVAFPT